MSRRNNYYTVYDNRTDDVIVAGNAITCAKYLGITVESFLFKEYRQRKQRVANPRYAIVVDEQNMEER